MPEDVSLTVTFQPCIYSPPRCLFSRDPTVQHPGQGLYYYELYCLYRSRLQPIR